VDSPSALRTIQFIIRVLDFILHLLTMVSNSLIWVGSTLSDCDSLVGFFLLDVALRRRMIWQVLVTYRRPPWRRIGITFTRTCEYLLAGVHGPLERYITSLSLVTLHSNRFQLRHQTSWASAGSQAQRVCCPLFVKRISWHDGAMWHIWSIHTLRT
jgi:hypothetical protein